MNRIVKFVAAVALTCAATVQASEQNAPVKVDAAKGEILFNTGAADRGVPACASCHGAAGDSAVAVNPKLAAQHAPYTHKQLKNFKDKTDRNNAVMSTYAAVLTDEEMRNVAAYLEKQKPSQGVAKNKDTIELGQKIYRGGIASKSVPACAACHGPNGSGIPAQYPRLGGQWSDYTEAQLVAFRSGQRKNSVQMVEIAAKMSDAEIKAVADYIAGLR